MTKAPEREPLERNTWVRVKIKGDYKDDLAQVVDVEMDGSKARVRLIPRLKLYVQGDEHAAKVRRSRAPRAPSHA